MPVDFSSAIGSSASLWSGPRLGFPAPPGAACFQLRLLRAADVVAAGLFVDQLHLPRLLEPPQAVGDRAGGPLDPLGDRNRAERQLAFVLFHVAEHEPVELTRPQPLLPLPGR